MPKLNKLLSNLPFNPSLIGQISFYAKRLKKETAVRRLGFALLVMAMLVQLFAAMSPPKSSLASSSNDLIFGGFTQQGQAVQHCLNPNEDFRIILEHYGINCSDLDYGHSSVVTIYQDDFNGQLYSMGRNPQGFASEQPVNIAGANNGQHLYIRYLSEWHSSKPYQALYLIMHGQKFFILFDCGNLVSEGVPTPPPAPTPTPSPPVTTPTPPADKTPLGFLDTVNCTKIAGWAFDQDRPTTSIDVHIYIDGVGAAVTTANVSRPDVGAAFPGAGNNHGFSVATPASIKNSKSHTIQIYAIGIDANGNKNGVNPLFGTKTVTLGTCTTPPPPPSGSASCSSLKATDLGNKKYSFLATTQGDDYVVNKYNFDFGDSTSQTVNNGLYIASVNHTYAKVGSYTVKVSIEVRVTTGTNTSTLKTVTCQTTITIKDTTTTKPCEQAQSSENLEACLTPHKQAKNVTKGGSDANGQTASAGDTIEYSLSQVNIGAVTVPKFVIRESVSDILDYADITDAHGGTLDDKTKIISWPAIDIKAGQTVTKLLTVKIKDPIPDTPISSSDPLHFDHRMTNVYGDTVIVNLPGNVVTLTQTVNGKLINTGPGTSVIAIVSLTVIVGYFFARSRLLSEEIDIVRSDYAATGGL